MNEMSIPTPYSRVPNTPLVCVQMMPKKNKKPKILKNKQEFEECEESSHYSYLPHYPFIVIFEIFLGLHMPLILFE